MSIAGSHNFNPCVVIPVFNHVAVLTQLVRLLRSKQLPVVLVDDGSSAQCQQLLQSLHREFDGVHLVVHQHNKGKGAAVKTALFEAQRLQFTHALQIDADGQHDTGDIELFLEHARATPHAMVAGYPAFDESVPKVRFYGRYASHVWVWINSLSFTIIDSMCGFRVYPVQASCALLQRCYMGNRMDFDGEFIVRWYWQNYPLVQIRTRVIYPQNGVSHFRLLHDNLLIAGMHARLFALMILQMPKLLARKFQKVPARP